ncbi:hypothetical protein D7V94_20200 [Parablautia intestinalis]|uniref:Nucleotidyltransferase n=1 Tax=Parablautia intestinalis TaxID=2320100 RepID=A0A3A9AKQ3_9FIRM|nr:hypothetical protein [Parablautia intestinalis]RKI87886.1 hypothetical protein D7V94_20200 [Parablautia intestinalis]
MNNFQYVTAEQLSSIKNDLIQIIHSVQNQVRQDFTFQFYFVGSVERNMVTHDVKSNVGFDFDVDIHVNDDGCKYSAKDIKTKIMLALNKVAYCYGYDNAEDSTRVITIKVKDRKNSKILHSCDFAIVNDYIDDDGNECQRYVHFNKKQNKYSWQKQPQGFYLLEEKAKWIKDSGHWQKVRDLYLDKKNHNNDHHKHSRSIYAETIHEICQKYGYYD